MISEQEYLLEKLEEVLNLIKDARPEERSELSRSYAVVITELEKVVAYFEKYVVGD